MAAELTEAASTADEAGLHEALVGFEATGVKIYFGAGQSRYSSNGPRLIYSLKLRIGEELKLSSREDTREMPITLALTRGISASSNAIGALYYVKKDDDPLIGNPTNLVAEITLPEQQFDELLNLAKLGRFPSKISMEVLSLKYGLRSDGSDKEWNIEKKTVLAINHIDFSLPLGGAAIDEAAEVSGKTIEQPFTRAMAEALHFQLAGIATSLRWIGFLVFALLAFLIWRALV